MISSVSLPLILPGAASGFQVALEQPLLPGKLILWVLFMLSLMSWAVMISKFLSLRKFNEGDIAFTKRLRQSKAPLEIQESGWNNAHSLRQEIYDPGAREAAFQILRSEEIESGGWTGDQVLAVKEAFHRGELAAKARLHLGMPVIQATMAGAPLLGLLGMIWIMMNSFGGEKEAVSEGISGALAMMAVGLFATIPALFGHIILKASFNERMRALRDFRGEICRLFERRFANHKRVEAPAKAHAKAPQSSAAAEKILSSDAAPRVAPKTQQATIEPRPKTHRRRAAAPVEAQQRPSQPQQSAAPKTPAEPAKGESMTAEPSVLRRKRKFHSVRHNGGPTEPIINPIAEQVARVSSQQS